MGTKVYFIEYTGNHTGTQYNDDLVGIALSMTDAINLMFDIIQHDRELYGNFISTKEMIEEDRKYFLSAEKMDEYIRSTKGYSYTDEAGNVNNVLGYFSFRIKEKVIFIGKYQED